MSVPVPQAERAPLAQGKDERTVSGPLRVIVAAQRVAGLRPLGDSESCRGFLWDQESCEAGPVGRSDVLPDKAGAKFFDSPTHPNFVFSLSL